MANGTQYQSVQDYVQQLASADPKTALQIAMAETQRVQALAQKANEEYRSMAKLEFDDQGRIKCANMAGLYRLAQMYSSSDCVPATFKGKPSDCFIACQLAFRMKIDPFALMQRMYVVGGRPGLEAQLAIAMLNSSGQIKGRIRWRWEGEGKTRVCTAVAIDAETGEEVTLSLDWKTVEAEKWHTKHGSKWLTMPDQMFRYRTATWLIRSYYPEVLMGLNTADELADMDPAAPAVQPVRTIEGLMAADQARPNGFQDHVGHFPSDEQLADADESRHAQQAEAEAPAEDTPEEAYDWRADKDLPDGAYAKLESAVSPEAVEAARVELLPRCQTAEQLEALGDAAKARTEEIKASRNQANGKGGKKQRNLA